MVSPEHLHSYEGDRYFSGKSANGIVIYIGPVTRDQLQDAGVMGQSTGYYLCEMDVSDPIGGLSVLASFTSVEAAYRLALALGLHELDAPITEFEDPLVPFVGTSGI
jgi:hypothetical protein